MKQGFARVGNVVVTAVIAVAATASVASAQDARPVLEMSASGEIEIGPDGSVQDYSLSGTLPSAIAEAVDRRVRKWKFEPVLVDGRAVIARTRLRLGLLAEPRGEDYQFRIHHVAFGDPQQLSSMRPPQYDMGAVRAGIGARVVLALKLDDKGSVVVAHPYQTSLDAKGSERIVAKWRRVFEATSIAAAKRWKFDPGEEISGHKVGGTMLVPVTYVAPTSKRQVADNTWRSYVPGPVVPVPWTSDTPLAADIARMDLKDGEARSISSRFQLKDDVVGTTL